MEKLVLHPTETSQWHALVNDAQLACQMRLNEDLESYLVFLLMRFSSQADVTSSVLAVDFLNGVQSGGQGRYEKLRDVGDKSLLFSGLFPGLAERKRVKISYFVDLGQSAYGTLSTEVSHDIAKLYADLCRRFVPLMDVLQVMRDMSSDNPQILPSSAQELWADTNSQYALSIFKETILSASRRKH